LGKRANHLSLKNKHKLAKKAHSKY
jgi:hypothetical protein